MGDVCGMRLFDTGLRIFGSFILWGFVLCVGAIFGICVGVWNRLPCRGRRDDKDTVRALMIAYSPYI